MGVLSCERCHRETTILYDLDLPTSLPDRRKIHKLICQPCVDSLRSWWYQGDTGS